MDKFNITKQFASKEEGYLMDRSDFAKCPICGKVFQGHKGNNWVKGQPRSRSISANHRLNQHLALAKHIVKLPYTEYVKLKQKQS